LLFKSHNDKKDCQATHLPSAPRKTQGAREVPGKNAARIETAPLGSPARGAT